jgi:hypothetical protein
MKTHLVRIVLILALTLVVMSVASAQDDGLANRLDGRVLPEAVAGLKLDEPLTMNVALDPSLHGATGEQEVIVRLTTGSIAEQGVRGNKARIAKQASSASRTG